MEKRTEQKIAGLILILLCAVPALLAGCAAVQAPPGNAAQELLWPPPPAEARIQWVMEIQNRLDAGIGKTFWQRVVEFVAGQEKDVIGKPYGIYADARERIFVADTGMRAVHEFDRKEKEYSLIGRENPVGLQTPIALTADDMENLYITDSAAATVFRYSIRDKILTRFITVNLERPTGIAFHAKKRLLYITDTANHQVVVFDLRGIERFRIGGRGEAAGSFNYPTDLFVDTRGDLYVTDALNARIQTFSAEGRFLRMFGTAGDVAGYLSKPKGVAVDSDSHIYVCDALQDSVQIFDRAGTLMLAFGENGTAPGQFWMPSGIFIDSSDTIYVADSYNRRIQVFKYLKTGVNKPAEQILKPADSNQKTFPAN